MTEAVTGPQTASSVRLGLKENWPQFALLVLINAFVGGMVGIERTVVPLIGSEEFKISSTTLVVSFIVNGVPTGRERTTLIDEIVINLANFDGRVE